MNEEGGGERARGACLRFVEDVEDDEVGREKSDSESDSVEELARLVIDGGEMVGLDGVQPTGERDRELELELVDEVDDLRREKLVKETMVIIELSVLEIFVRCELGLCRLLEDESQTQVGDPRSDRSTSDYRRVESMAIASSHTR